MSKNDFIKELKKKWRNKCASMEIMSGDVAIFELEALIDDTANDTANPKKLETIFKISNGMYNVNRYISFHHIALKEPMTEREIGNINRFIGEWILQLREIGEEEW